MSTPQINVPAFEDEEPTRVDDVIVVGRRNRGPASGFSLSEFMSEINVDTTLQSCRHLMQFTLPRGMVGSKDPNDVKKVILRCDTSALPGVALAESEEIRRYGIGPGVKQAYMPVFGPISASYIVDGEGKILQFFHEWMSLIVGFDSENGMSSENGYGALPYEVGYKDDYSSDVKIYVYNTQNDKIVEVTLAGAHPVSIDAIPLSWSATDEFMKLNVTWDYTDWHVRFFDKSGSPIESFLGGGAGIGSIINRPKLPGVITSLIGNLGSKSQRINDIMNVVSNGKQTIVDAVKKRIGF